MRRRTNSPSPSEVAPATCPRTSAFGTPSAPLNHARCCCWVTTCTSTILRRPRCSGFITTDAKASRSGCAWPSACRSTASGMTTTSPQTTAGAAPPSMSPSGSARSGKFSRKTTTTPTTVAATSSPDAGSISGSARCISCSSMAVTIVNRPRGSIPPCLARRS